MHLMVLLTFFQNTGYQKGKPGMSKVFVAPVDFFDVNGIPEPPATGAAAGDTATIDPADFVFKTGKGFIDLKNDLFKGSELDWKSDGEPSAPGIMAEIKGRSNGQTAAQIEQFCDLLGVPLIVVVQDADCKTNEWKGIGCDCDHAFMAVEGKSGTKGGSDAKGTSFSIKAACAPYTFTVSAPLTMLP